MSKLEQLQALREAKSSRGGVDGHAQRQTKPTNGVAPVPRPGVSAVEGKVGPQARKQAGVESGPRDPKRGRPRIEDRAKTLQATKPWESAGMSERTWYRRRAEKREQ